MQSPLYNQKGEEVGKISLPESIFAMSWNANLVHETAVSMMANARANTAHTKERGEVRGGGRKPWRQKGTGRARHGSIRSPLWVGGGVTFGPRNERRYAKKINQKAKTKALFSVLSEKLRRGEVFFLDSLSLAAPKTREASRFLEVLGISLKNDMHTKEANAVAIALPAKDEALERSFANIRAAAVGEIRSMNLLDVLRYKYLVIVNPEESVSILQQRAKTTGKIIHHTSR